MTEIDYETLRLRAQLSVLREVQREYAGRTIENIINNLESRVNFFIKRQEKSEE